MKPMNLTSAPSAPVSGWRKVFPHPVLSLQLGLSWLVLSHSLALVHWLSAVLFALVVPRLLSPFLGEASRLNWTAVVRLLLVVLWDIVISNITVARITLGSMSAPKPAWLRVPLATDHPRVNALFASIITTTPGTVSMTIDEQRREILVHALNCDDPQGMINDMKSRYEQPLMTIFQVSGDQARSGSEGQA